MIQFFHFASAHDALRSLFARGPVGLTAQFFLYQAEFIVATL
jgi:hypothetical protein